MMQRMTPLGRAFRAAVLRAQQKSGRRQYYQRGHDPYMQQPQQYAQQQQQQAPVYGQQYQQGSPSPYPSQQQAQYAQYYQAYAAHQQARQDEAQQGQEQPNGMGSWTNPVIISMQVPRSQRLWDFFLLAQYYQAYAAHQQARQDEAQQGQEQPNGMGSWTNPVIISMQVPRSQRLWDFFLLVQCMFVLYWLAPSVSFSVTTVDEDGNEIDEKSNEGAEPPRTKGSEGSTKEKEEPSTVSTLFGGFMGQDKVKPVDLSQAAHNVHWDDVLGCDEAKAELIEVTEFLKKPEKFTRLGGKLPKGYLLVGPPGTGKTMLAKAIAREAGVPFFYASGSQFEEVYVGVGSKRVRELFEAAREHAPCLLFIDEIDSVGGERSPRDGSHDRATINQLLAEMDGFNSSDSVVVIAATNSPKTLDKALTRPGRLDRTVSVDPPDLRGRTQILQHYLKKVVRHDGADPKVIARGTSGMTGAELANIVNIATINAAKKGLTSVTLPCLEEAKDRVLMGIEHKTRRVPEHERTNTAYHEAGHALVALFSKEAPPLHKATIIPRGQSLGVTVQLPQDDQMSMSLAQMKSRLRVLMGGRIAESVVFGDKEVTSGASNDLEQATNLARSMVRKYGLSSGMGMVDYSFADDPNGMFLSNATRSKIENEVRQLVDQAYADAHHTITSKRSILNAIATGLLENDTLTGADMRKLAGIAEPADEAHP
eukprot:TRINITY_DN1431_c0_g1_i2.p1 TRINITY_DN1431_c0_g1~~TRINITY_DN1431_c0_g1_i2.p1  ORF type:complete len:715 (+),score=306.24 TRINITY_DN1431_c0_g1_i2:26-2146(+)